MNRFLQRRTQYSEDYDYVRHEQVKEAQKRSQNFPRWLGVLLLSSIVAGGSYLKSRGL